MQKINEYKGIIILALVLILGAFYWFQLRPAHIRKECNGNAFLINNQGTINSPGWLDAQEKLYNDCLKWRGLEK